MEAKSFINKWIPLIRNILLIVLVLLISNEVFKYVSNKLNLIDIRQGNVVLYLFLHHLYYIICGFALYLWMGKGKWHDLGLKFNKEAIKLTLLGLVLMIVLYLLAMLLTQKLGFATWRLTASVSIIYVLQAVLIRGIMIGIGEEVLFRGYLFNSLRSYGKSFSYIVSGLIFAGWHFLNGGFELFGFLSILLASFFFTYTYDHTGSIWPPVIFHGAIDLLATLFTWNMKEVSIVNMFWIGSSESMMNFFKWFNPTMIIVLLSFVWIFNSYKKKTDVQSGTNIQS